MDAELSADVHQAVGDVVARVAAEDELALAERLFGVLHQRQDIGKRLRRVVDVGQAVPHGHARVGGETLDDLLVVAAVLDAVVEAAEDLGGVDHRFLLAHLGGLGIEEGDVRALVVSGDFERAAGAGRGLFKQQHDVLAGEQVAADTGALFGLEVSGEIKHIADLVGGEVFQRQERAAFQIDGHWEILLNKSKFLAILQS